VNNYAKTVFALFGLLADARNANTFLADDWHQDSDAEGYFNCLKQAIIEIAGEPIVNQWLSTSQVDITLATRFKGEAESSLIKFFL